MYIKLLSNNTPVNSRKKPKNGLVRMEEKEKENENENQFRGGEVN